MLAEQLPAFMESVARDFEQVSLADALRECHDHLVEGIRDMFATETGPDGEVWPKRVSAEQGSHPLLNKTGELYRAATGSGSGHVNRVGDRSLVVGVEKSDSGSRAGAAVHQYGATIVPRRAEWLTFKIGDRWVRTKRVVIPARPYIGATSEALDKCRDEISDAVKERVFDQ